MEDLLGSILNKMDKPPSATEQQRLLLKKQREDSSRRQEEERCKLLKFKEEMEKRLSAFVQDDSLVKLEMPPMNKVQRSVIHEIAEIAGHPSFSIGEEDVDRHVVVFKKEFVPCPQELNAIKKGQTWNLNEVCDKSSETPESPEENKFIESKKDSGQSHYLNKYERILGKETVKEAAKVTQVNRKYGFVSSENKKDSRSIEQTLADIRAKKRQKTDD